MSAKLDQGDSNGGSVRLTATHCAYGGVGGTGSLVSELCPRLRSHLSEGQVVFYGVEPVHSAYETQLKDAGIAVHEIPKKPGVDVLSRWALLKKLKEIGSQVIVMHGGGTAWHWPLLRLFGVKSRMVLVEHGPEAGCTTFGGFLRHAIGIFFADAVIAVSARLADKLASRFRFFLGGKRVSVIPNGVDPEFFLPDPAKISPGLLLMAGTLSPTKDHTTLLRAFAMLPAKHSARLHLAGDGALRGRLERLAKDLGIQERVTFHGNLNKLDLLQLYQQAAVLAFSTRGEGSPLAMLEGMSCGVPVVASDVPGVHEVLAGQDCGLLASPSDPASLAEAIGQLLFDPEAALRMGGKARRLVEANYSLDRMAAQYKEVLDAVRG